MNGANLMAKKMSKKPTKVSKKTATKSVAAKPKQARTKSAKPKLLSGGNPQIGKAYGDAPVQTYIASMPGWKGGIGRRLDEIITRTVPNVYKAVKWNTPFYGFEEEPERGAWFLGFHCVTQYVKVAFFNGSQLKPIPPGESTQKDVRYLHIYENEPWDEQQFVDWVKQASKLPLKRM